MHQANNQAIREAEGEYILLLNPDTLVEEDTFEKTIAFMGSHPDAGGLGVKMVDGKGEFLKELTGLTYSFGGFFQDDRTSKNISRDLLCLPVIILAIFPMMRFTKLKSFRVLLRKL